MLWECLGGGLLCNAPCRQGTPGGPEMCSPEIPPENGCSSCSVALALASALELFAGPAGRSDRARPDRPPRSTANPDATAYVRAAHPRAHRHGAHRARGMAEVGGLSGRNCSGRSKSCRATSCHKRCGPIRRDPAPIVRKVSFRPARFSSSTTLRTCFSKQQTKLQIPPMPPPNKFLKYWLV